MAWINSWLRLFLVLGLGVGVPVLVIAWLSQILIKRPALRILAGFLVWGAVLSTQSTHCSPPLGQFQLFVSKQHLRQIYPALVSYRRDHGNAWPERLSQLVPDYVSRKDLNCFFNVGHPGAPIPKSFSKSAAADPTEVDRHGMFDYFPFGKTGEMMAANRTPIKEDRFGIGRTKFVRVVLEQDGKISVLPEQEYQQRLKLVLPPEESGKSDTTGKTGGL